MQLTSDTNQLNIRAPEAQKIHLHVDDVQELMSFLMEDSETAPHPTPNMTRPQAPLIPVPICKRKEIYKVLLRRDDSHFIRSAYLMLLGRLPEEGGAKSALGLLRHQGMSRIDFLLHVLSSHEASIKSSKLMLSVHEIRLARSIENLLRAFSNFFFRRASSNHISPQSPKTETDELFLDSIQDLTRNTSLLAKAVGQLNEAFRTLQKDQEKTAQELSHICQAAANLQNDVKELRSINETLQVSIDRQLRPEFDERFKALENRQAYIEAKIRTLSAASLQTPNTPADSERSKDTPIGNVQDTHCTIDVAHYYFEFENAFRGEEGVIKDRVRYYLDLIDSELGPILDLGCGRGEWLEVLKESNIKSYGVDSNETSLMRCVAKGLDVRLDDGLHHLRSLADNSLGAITAMHVIEHLPWETVLELIYEAYRVLIPGGILIMETPNPENVLVGSCYFYHDPTHKNPIVPSVLHFTVKYFGFETVEILRFRPTEFLDSIDPKEWAQPLLHAFNASQDFAVVGRKG